MNTLSLQKASIRIIGILLVICLLSGVLPIPSFAATSPTGSISVSQSSYAVGEKIIIKASVSKGSSNFRNIQITVFNADDKTKGVAIYRKENLDTSTHSFSLPSIKAGDTITSVVNNSKFTLEAGKKYVFTLYATDMNGNGLGTNGVSSSVFNVVEADDDIIPTGVKMNKTSATINVNETLQLTATVSPSNATDKSVSWTSSNSKVATVSSKGIITAIKTGTTTITAKTNSGSKTAACSIMVSAATSPTGSVSVLKSSYAVGEQITINASVTKGSANFKNIQITIFNADDKTKGAAIYRKENLDKSTHSFSLPTIIAGDAITSVVDKSMFTLAAGKNYVVVLYATDMNGNGLGTNGVSSSIFSVVAPSTESKYIKGMKGVDSENGYKAEINNYFTTIPKDYIIALGLDSDLSNKELCSKIESIKWNTPNSAGLSKKEWPDNDYPNLSLACEYKAKKVGDYAIWVEIRYNDGSYQELEITILVRDIKEMFNSLIITEDGFRGSIVNSEVKLPQYYTIVFGINNYLTSEQLYQVVKSIKWTKQNNKLSQQEWTLDQYPNIPTKCQFTGNSKGECNIEVKIKFTNGDSIIFSSKIIIVEECISNPPSEEQGILNAMRARADAIVNYVWIPSRDIATWNGNLYNGSDKFEKGKEVIGMPYTLFTSEFKVDSLLSLNQYKDVYINNYSKTEKCIALSTPKKDVIRTGPIYGSCCATFISEVWGGSFVNAKGDPIYDSVGGIESSNNIIKYKNAVASDIKPGDALSISGHIIFIGEVTDDSFVIYEQTPPVARKIVVKKSESINAKGYLKYNGATYKTICRPK